MRNEFAGKCYRCNLPVAAGTGHFQRHFGKWRVHHANYPGHGRVTCAAAYKKRVHEKGARIDEVIKEKEMQG